MQGAKKGTTRWSLRAQCIIAASITRLITRVIILLT
jgi:hypothetical protein